MHSGSVFTDLSKLSFDYVPDKLPHRERQLKALHILFHPVLQGSAAQNVFLTGGVGTGKTVVSKLFAREMRAKAQDVHAAIEFVFVNCRQRSSDAAAMLKILMHFDPHFPDRGFSIPEMLEVLRKHIERRGAHLIVVLDEADVLIKKGTELIYALSRFGEDYPSTKRAISLILISQKHILDFMDASSLSTFKRGNIIEFGKYSEEELYDIAKARAEIALIPDGISEDALRLIADVASEWGDARYCIELLERAGMLADEAKKEQIGVEEVRGAKAFTYPIIDEQKLMSLNEQEMLSLLAVCRVLRTRAYCNTGIVEREYRAICEELNKEPRGHTQFWKYLKSLSAHGFIEVKKKQGVGGSTQLISLPDMPAAILEEHINTFIEGQG